VTVFGRPEQCDTLVDEVRAEVHQQAIGGVRGFFPGVLALDRPVAVEVRLEGDEAAQRAVGKNFLDGQEIPIPAAVMEWRNDHTLRRGESDQLFGFGAGAGERLVDDNMFSGGESLFGQRVVRLVGGSDDD